MTLQTILVLYSTANVITAQLLIYFGKWVGVGKFHVVFQLLKYTEHNLERYLHYLVEIQKIPWSKLKFADEAHFVYKDLTTQGKVLGLQSEQVWIRRKTKFDATLTILTRLDSSSSP